MPEPRRPFTCANCYEQRGVNVDLVDQGLAFDNRSVSAKINYQCPECHHEVKFDL